MTQPNSIKPSKKSIIDPALATMAQLPGIHTALQLAAWRDPGFDSFFQLGSAFLQTGHVTAARDNLLKATAARPESAEAFYNLALAHERSGETEAAHAAYVQAIGNCHEDQLAEAAFGNLFALQDMRDPFDASRLAEAQALYRMYYESKHAQEPTFILKPHQPLKIGFVSADFRSHPVGYFLESTLDALRRLPGIDDRLQLIAYYNHQVQDDYTFRLSDYFDGWYRVDQWSDERLAAQIKTDRIDILIDLAGHTRGHRLPVFARRAAPAQVSWLGYWASTGLSRMDYVIADPITVPEDEASRFSERVWRLPNLRYCFSVPEDVPEVSPPPSLSQSGVVFGCYQMLHKVNDSVLSAWARILAACPDARLRIQSKDLDDARIKAQFIRRLQTQGIALPRVTLVGTTSREVYLASYAEVDVLLDTFHFPGGTTTAEALWMGVPTLTLALPGMVSRQGEALLMNAGLADWVTHDLESYIRQAIAWGNADQAQRQALADLRARLREQVRLSPVFDAERFAADVAHALEGIWQAKRSA